MGRMTDNTPTVKELVEERVFQALGAASMCWENPEGAGVFLSDRAKAIGAELVAWILSGEQTRDE